MPNRFTMGDGSQWQFGLSVSRRTPSSSDVWDTMLWDTGAWDGGGTPTPGTVDAADLLALRSRRGKNFFRQQFRAGELAFTLDNEGGKYSPETAFLWPGDYIYVTVTAFPPPGPTPPFDAEVFPVFYGRIDSARDDVRLGRDVIDVVAYDCFAELAAVEEDPEAPQGAGEPFVTRLQRIVADTSNILADVAILGDQSTVTYAATELDGNRLQEIQQTAFTEGGDVFAAPFPSGPGGRSRLIGSTRLWNTTAPRSLTPQFNLGGGGGPGIVAGFPSRELSEVVNDVSFANKATGQIQRRQDAASQLRYGRRRFVNSALLGDNDVDAAALAQRYIDYSAAVAPTVRSVTVPVVDAASVVVAGAEMLDLVTATIVSQNGWGTVESGHIIGIAHTVVGGDWSMVLTLDDTFAPSGVGPVSLGAYDWFDYGGAFEGGQT